MFSLIYGLWQFMFSKLELRVLILGIDKAGKTTLLEKIKSVYTNVEGLPPDRIVPTVGLNIGRIEVANRKLVFWDLGGQDLPEAVSSEELARYLDLKKLDERVYLFEAVSAYDGLGIRESAEWLVEVMERSKRTEMLRLRAGAMGPGPA